MNMIDIDIIIISEGIKNVYLRTQGEGFILLHSHIYIRMYIFKFMYIHVYKGIGIVAYSPLGRGFLSDTFSSIEDFTPG